LTIAQKEVAPHTQRNGAQQRHHKNKDVASLNPGLGSVGGGRLWNLDVMMMIIGRGMIHSARAISELRMLLHAAMIHMPGLKASFWPQSAYKGKGGIYSNTIPC